MNIYQDDSLKKQPMTSVEIHSEYVATIHETLAAITRREQQLKVYVIFHGIGGIVRVLGIVRYGLP